MNKICLDKLCDFSLTTYKNYEVITKNFNFKDYVDNIKQNQSLNENGIFFKHNFIELKTLIPEIEYDHLVLINPICWNLNGNFEFVEWFNFLNVLLTVMNDNYLHEINTIKKTILETTDKTLKKKITNLNEFNDEIIKSVCLILNITLIILTDNFSIKLFNNNDKIDKIVVMFNREKEYYCVMNWNQKYYNANSEFIKYLLNKNSADTNNKNNVNNKNSVDNKNHEPEFICVINNNKKKCINKLKKNNFVMDTKNDDEITNKNNKGTYEELQADENYALYVSEVVDKTDDKKINTLTDKKKKKNDKNIFVVNKQDLKIQILNEKDINNDIKKDINNDIKKNINKDIDKIIEESNENQSSIFNKTEKITYKDVEKIANGVKITMGLETIQAEAIKLGIKVAEGSTKTGKPKNKTKSELIEQIKNFFANFKK